MCCGAAAEPSAELKAAIDEAFGGMDELKKQLKAAGATQFGSGWAWLVKGKDGKLAVTKTLNAENPVCHGQTPLLTVDVWEHVRSPFSVPFVVVLVRAPASCCEGLGITLDMQDACACAGVLP
jgi:hypothetical protein